MTYKTEFNIAKMDCLSEEQLIRMKLQDFEGIKSLQFDIPNRKLQVYHEGNAEHLLAVLESLNLNTTLIATQEDTTPMTQSNSQHEQKKLLWTVLIINFVFFAIAMGYGFLSNSMGLVADSLDMLADSMVYALALCAVGGSIAFKSNIAKFAGYFQIRLALVGFGEVVRRVGGIEEGPDCKTMSVVSVLAL